MTHIVTGAASGVFAARVEPKQAEEETPMDADFAAHEAMDAMTFKGIKHQMREIKHELEEEMGNCNNGFDSLAGLAALGLMWDRNRGYGDGYGVADGIRDLQLSQQINDSARGVTNDITSMSTQLHDQGNFNNLNTTILTTQNALSNLINASQLQTSEQSLYLRGEMGNLRTGQDAIDQHISATSMRLGDKICEVEKTQLRDYAALSRQMSECCCELKTEGMANTQRMLDEIRCYREKDLEKEILTLRGAVSQRDQTAALVAYLASAGIVPAVATPAA
jgi:predicted transcriptional regulator